MTRMILFVGLLVVGSMPSAAQEKATTARTLSEKQRDIGRLLRLTGQDKLAEQVAFVLFEQSKARLETQYGQNTRTKEALDLFWRLTRERVNSEALIALSTPGYERHFSHEEILELIRLYETPIGKKIVEVTPRVIQESQEEATKFWQRTYAEIMSELSKRFPEMKAP